LLLLLLLLLFCFKFLYFSMFSGENNILTSTVLHPFLWCETHTCLGCQSCESQRWMRSASSRSVVASSGTFSKRSQPYTIPEEKGGVGGGG
jgi:hypothetical protein